MRPPSYYASIVKNNNSHYGSNYDSYDGSSYKQPSTRTSNALLRSSLSSPSSSSYVSRSHLPFVSQSSLVAHSYTGAGSTTSRTSGSPSSSFQYTSPTTYSPSSASSLSPYYSSSTSLSSRPASLKRSSHLTSPSSSSSSSSSYAPSSNYTSTSSSSSSSSYAVSKPYLRPSHLTPTTSGASLGSASSRPGYRPISSPSTYYQPIRLRERPLLTAISRQLNRRQSISKRSGTHSTRNDEQAEPLVPPTIVTTTVEPTAGGANESGEAKLGEKTSADEKEEEASWSSDITRNISRNKYLIKFREIDKQARPSLADVDVVASIELAPIDTTSIDVSADLEPAKREPEQPQVAAIEEEPIRRPDEDKRSRESVVPDREEDRLFPCEPPTIVATGTSGKPSAKKVPKAKTKVRSAAASSATESCNTLQVTVKLSAQEAQITPDSASDKRGSILRQKRDEVQVARPEAPDTRKDTSQKENEKSDDGADKSRETLTVPVVAAPAAKKERRNVKLKLKPFAKNKSASAGGDGTIKIAGATSDEKQLTPPQPLLSKLDTSVPVAATMMPRQEQVHKLPAERAAAPLALAATAAVVGESAVKQTEPKLAGKAKKVIKRRGSKLPAGEDERDAAREERQKQDTVQDQAKERAEVDTVTRKKKGDGDKPKVKKLLKKSSTSSLTSAPKDKTTGKGKQSSEPGTPRKPPQASSSSSSLVESGTPTTPTANGPKARIRFRQYNYNDFNFLTVLGHGGWGFVILAELKGHDACFAVKCIKKITIVEDDDYDSIMIERKVLALGNVHPFICKLFCTFETEGYLFFVMEYCAGGDLMFHVQREGKFSESRCRFYAAEIICAMRFLHNRHIIYRDLKLDNILLDERGHIRLVDFGMCQCRTYREEMLPSNFCGTPEYISPEIIKGVPYNHSVDWWSFGVLLYEMAVGKMPFRGQDENELLWNVCYEQIHYPMFLSKELTSLLKLLLEREPTKRLGMATCKAGDIYDQPYFRGVDWKAVEELRVEPPFIPEVNSNRDVQNFDSDFTESTCELSPVDQDTLDKIDQKQFEKFPYTNPEISIFDPTTR